MSDYTGKYMQSGKGHAIPSHMSLCVKGPGGMKTKFSFPFTWALGAGIWFLDLKHKLITAKH